MLDPNYIVDALKVSQPTTSLVGGGPLQIEDLDVTLVSRTYTLPKRVSQAALNRILRKLTEMKHGYSLRTDHTPNWFIYGHLVLLKLSEREIKFEVIN